MNYQVAKVLTAGNNGALHLELIDAKNATLKLDTTNPVFYSHAGALNYMRNLPEYRVEPPSHVIVSWE